jgi:CCR4-NOT transcriptional regulation complex NOT5 subunit
MTVATSAVEQMTTISNAPTSVISREYNKLERNLQEQIKKRFKLQQQIKKMQAKNNKDQKIISMMDNNDR